MNQMESNNNKNKNNNSSNSLVFGRWPLAADNNNFKQTVKKLFSSQRPEIKNFPKKEQVVKKLIRCQ